MADMNAGQVMALRKKTGLPMMECKEALSACHGDEAAAIDWLTKKHKGKMDARSDRETGEGRIGVYVDAAKGCGGIIELRCETAPVAKNEMFIELANAIARHVAEGKDATPDANAIAATMQSRMTDVYGRLRETMKIGQCRRVAGEVLTSYVHHDGKSGVLLALAGKPTDEEVGKNLAMHVAFHRPLAIERSGVPAEQVDRVRQAATDMAREDGKPANMIEKIAEGKVNAFFAEKVLMEQEHARTDLYGRKKVRDVLREHGVTAVTDMAFVAVGA